MVGNRAEADRWLVTSEKLLASSDLHGAKSFAIRACESDPTRAEAADYILAICDILIAGSLRLTDSNLPDWYSVLRLGRPTQSPEHVATQYRRLALLLNPSVNRLPFADKAFDLVSDAWRVLSDPIRKSSYDREVLQQRPSQRLGEASDPTETSFWTACPYCFVLFEYPKHYEECVLKCQDCKRAFQAVRIQKPPLAAAAVEGGGGEDVYFCSWSVFPLGFSGGEFQAAPTRNSWSPISPLFAIPIDKKRKEPASPRIFYDDDDVYVAISEDDGDEVSVGRGKGKEAFVRSGSNKKQGGGGVVVGSSCDTSSSRKGGAKNVGRLDLNEEPGVGGGRREGNGVGSNREVDNMIEGIGFFEGLDEFLMSMPILSVVGDDKIKAT
ncbi:Chaperone DnaJ-domain superfamily protein [Raphanus sativus]|uniref:Uncharacterized protein LOC108838820 n=1 Tax=Raphanus sativus TaxID=3726 RepID=A0A6J0M435_RAPSA|nr:uncharacterized protein LOC108838820 [Raphanus sativus]KAJ4871731.1 Chaperone DnaJ-domain superfamily protein [Raphanus sativus]